MAKILINSGEYFKVIDSITLHPEVNKISSDIYYTPYFDKTKVFFYDRNTEGIVDDSKGTRGGYLLSELLNGSNNNEPFASFTELSEYLDNNTGGVGTTHSTTITLATNDLGLDAWGRPKVILDKSILHGMFTYNVPVTIWKELYNGTERVPTNATSVNGKLHLSSGLVTNDVTVLDTFRNPRYQPNRGHLYSTALFLPNPTAQGIREWGTCTEQSGVFFRLKQDGLLYGVIRTTIDGVMQELEEVIDTTGVDLSKGQVYDIQFQWRGVGDYQFFLNLNGVKKVSFLGTRTELTMFNPANPIAFYCENLGEEVVIECGCVDITSEGGGKDGGIYGSIQIDNESGQVALTDYNAPVIAIRSKLYIDGLRNTRDTLALLASAYSNQKSLMRFWATRDFTAIIEGTQVWKDFGDGHLEYLVLDPTETTPMTLDTAKASPPIFGSRIPQDGTYTTSALFEGRTDIWLTPGDMFIFTNHRENGGLSFGGVTFEFAEQI